ncbi:hypothetical protein Q428_07495 [Fervidicella metallireducens AeB]|uniref:Arginase n=1 Tax=Fervidicella metallireducens AeB TaxID=1403537 RepID=A0A017RUT4_9CLOT|nr:arginase [Fervidicella metallireducens]EYE88513.1 hypothetical protein Q428_07495 [Fervidicella metallireducens AeB]
MKINVIGMPIHYGADKEGCDFAPNKLREMNIQKTIENLGYEVEDLGDIDVVKVSSEDKFQDHPKMKYLNAILDANTKLAEMVHQSISKGNFPLILGGDHCLGLGSIAGVSTHIEKLGVIWIDAHGDLNTLETSPTGNIHGMPLAASMGLGHESLVNIYKDRIKIKEDYIVHIAGRDLDEGEIEILNQSKIKAFPMEMVKKVGMTKIIEETLQYLKSRVDGIHVSFDLDAIDSRYVPGTGTKVDNGITVEEARQLLTALASSGMMVSLDFVELNPLLDVNDTTAKISVDLLTDIFKNLK